MPPIWTFVCVLASHAPRSGCLSMLPSQWEHHGMQLMAALLDVITFMGVLGVMAGMALVPWLVDGLR